MTKRQVKIFLLLFFSLLAGLFACSPQPEATLPPTPIQPSPLPPSPTPTATPIPTPTLPLCREQLGHVEKGSISTTNPPQDYLIYLPPCYADQTDRRYPVLYLLHGQTYTADQWIRLGATDVANQLIRAREAQPFIIVFPDDHYWNLPAGPGFGQRLVEVLIPYIDEHYRTLSDRSHRALGGLSRGGGWTVRIGFTQWNLFGTLGLHSPAVFAQDGSSVKKWIAAVPPDSWPRLWLDIGDQDKELSYALQLENLLGEYDVPHEFHLYSGDHSESYWQRHMEEYLRWYVAGWEEQP